jgi:hemerythrin-like domain-containing protein
MDAITLLKDDHRSVEKLFKRFEDAGDRAFVEKRKAVDRIIEELSVHAAIEEQLFYPVTRATVPAVEDVALESLEEHHIVKWVLSELEGMHPEDERFDAKVTVLIENVRHHVEEEESEYFPEVRSALGRKALGELGDAMASAKETAPTRPHPRAPDTPPGNVVAGAAAGLVDKVGATVGGLAQGGVDAVQDLIDRIRGQQSRRPSPTGSSRTRRTAGAVRAGSDESVERVVAAVRAAESGAEDTAGEAVAGARRAGAAAGRAARDVADDVKSAAGDVADGARKAADDAKAGADRTTKAVRSAAQKTTSTARSSARRTARKAKGTSTSTTPST